MFIDEIPLLEAHQHRQLPSLVSPTNDAETSETRFVLMAGLAYIFADSTAGEMGLMNYYFGNFLRFGGGRRGMW